MPRPIQFVRATRALVLCSERASSTNDTGTNKKIELPRAHKTPKMMDHLHDAFGFFFVLMLASLVWQKACHKQAHAHTFIINDVCTLCARTSFAILFIYTLVHGQYHKRAAFKAEQQQPPPVPPPQQRITHNHLGTQYASRRGPHTFGRPRLFGTSETIV